MAAPDKPNDKPLDKPDQPNQPKPSDPVIPASPGAQARAAAAQAAAGVSDADKRDAEKREADKRDASIREGEKRQAEQRDREKRVASGDDPAAEKEAILEELRNPISDRGPTGSGTPIPPAVLGGPVPVDDELVAAGTPIPELRSLTGEEQSRFEVLTGKRLQKPEVVVVAERKVREAKEARAQGAQPK